MELFQSLLEISEGKKKNNPHITRMGMGEK